MAQTKTSKRLEEANVTLNTEVKKAEMYRKTTLQNTYLSQPKVAVAVSPMYKPYFGEVMEVLINGIYISVPCDGRQHEIPETFADEVNRRIMAVDESNRRADQMADVANNREEVQGDIQFFN